MPWVLCFFNTFLSSGKTLIRLWSDSIFGCSLYFLVYGYIVLILSLAAALRLTPLKTFLCLVITIIFSLFPLILLFQLLAPHLLPVK